MSGGDLAAVIVAVAAVAAVVLLGVGLVSLTRTVRGLRASVEELQRTTLPVVAELRATVEQANAELGRAEEVLGNAETVTASVGRLSHLLYLLLANPVVKVLALASGTNRAARALRRER